MVRTIFILPDMRSSAASMPRTPMPASSRQRATCTCCGCRTGRAFASTTASSKGRTSAPPSTRCSRRSPLGADRAQAIARLREAMRETVALGTVTNAAYLERVLAHPSFTSGGTHTGFLTEHADALRASPPDPDQLAVLLAAAALTHRQFDARFACPEPLGAMGEWRN